MKKNILILIGVTLAYSSVKAQFPQNMFRSPNQQLIEQAVHGGFLIVKQSYQLDDNTTHQRYGRYGNEEFGKSFALAIKVDNGIIINDITVRPWKYDENYTRYETTHSPVKLRTEIKDLSANGTFGVVNIEDDKLATWNEQLHYLNDTVLCQKKGFQTMSPEKDSAGWLVWVNSRSRIEDCNADAQTSFTIYKHSIDYASEVESYDIEAPNVDGFIWGGIYIVPEQTAIGQLTFKIAGVLVREQDNRWKLYPIQTIKAKEAATIPQELVPENELTPHQSAENNVVDDTKKKSKNKQKDSDECK